MAGDALLTGGGNRVCGKCYKSMLAHFFAKQTENINKIPVGLAGQKNG